METAYMVIYFVDELQLPQCWRKSLLSLSALAGSDKWSRSLDETARRHKSLRIPSENPVLAVFPTNLQKYPKIEKELLQGFSEISVQRTSLNLKFPKSTKIHHNFSTYAKIIQLDLNAMVHSAAAYSPEEFFDVLQYPNHLRTELNVSGRKRPGLPRHDLRPQSIVMMMWT
ncbi:hypothetical protein DFH09DRAFT_1079301 [Mycena vulgaris]|nr:hypothetical protein DFH09DRAFT_1079301 [Mycena vulgaris]